MGLRDERERYRGLLVSCLGCGSLCVDYLGRGDLWDVREADVVDYLIPVVGLGSYLAQGIGVCGGRGHQCPPTRSPLTEVVTPPRRPVGRPRAEPGTAKRLKVGPELVDRVRGMRAGGAKVAAIARAAAVSRPTVYAILRGAW